MAEITKSLSDVYNGLRSTFSECGFSPVIPEGTGNDELPCKDEGGRKIFEFSGENKGAKIEYFNNKIYLYGVFKEGEILNSDYSKLAESLFEADSADEKDVRYIVNDFSDTLTENFGNKSSKAVKAKLPTPVSKAAAKSGAVSYDPNTLANRFTTIFTELRGEYKANIEKYGQFLPEDFFVNHGNRVVIETIKRNDPTEMKRMFKLFNEIYEDGTNETQSLIAVTILGSLENNQELLANCVDYMSDDIAPIVININRYLWSKDGKGARIKLENPPQYKPKK
ncbi:MAG: hypothetical protein K6F64_04180, partial [Clostridia bacterium]|nr:hypothetical protein [Clostridia bacterium]